MKKGRIKKVKTTIPRESIEKAIEILGNGNSIAEAKILLYDFQKERGLSTSINYLANIVSEANNELINEYSQDRRHVISLHIQRYNRDIVNLINTPNPWEKEYENEDKKYNAEEGENEEDDEVGYEKDSYKKRERLIAKYFTALQSIYQKEKVLQMHSKGFLINITNKISNVADPISQFDLSKLNDKEKSDFLQLILKTKKNEFENGSVILKNRDRNANIEDAEVIEIIEEPNINKVKQLPQPKTLTPERPVGASGSTLLDINEKLKLALQKKAVNEYKNAGSKTIEFDEAALRQLQPTKNDSK